MSQLQAAGDTREMIRLTARAMHKLAFFYFPIYIFLVITANTFIVTLFTRNYEASVPIFLINITLMPFYIWVIDPIVRSFKELGRMLLFLRVFVFAAMLTALFFGIRYFDMRGMIAIVVVTVLFEKLISTVFVIRKLRVNKSDAHLLVEVFKTAVASLTAGAATFAFYRFGSGQLKTFVAETAQGVFGLTKISMLDFMAGGVVLAVCFLIFTPIYLLCAHYLGTIDDDDRRAVLSKLRAIGGRLRRKNSLEERDLLSADQAN
jgi:hypothetical protein